MRIKTTLALLTGMSASAAFADARFDTLPTLSAERPGLLYAQATLETLGDSELRRMVFYSDRAIQALAAVVQGAENRDVIAQSKVNMAFRMAASRLADAGARTGLSIEQVTDFFTQNVAESFGQGFMQQVNAAANGLDFYTLFRSVSFMADPRSGGLDDGMLFLNALARVTRGKGPDANSGVVETPARQPAGSPATRPVAQPNATIQQRAIVDRVVVNGDRWEIVVAQGDSLAIYADAIYGNSLSFDVIYQANIDILNNPNTLRIGTVIRLPKP